MSPASIFMGAASMRCRLNGSLRCGMPQEPWAIGASRLKGDSSLWMSGNPTSRQLAWEDGEDSCSNGNSVCEMFAKTTAQGEMDIRNWAVRVHPLQKV